MNKSYDLKVVYAFIIVLVLLLIGAAYQKQIGDFLFDHSDNPSSIISPIGIQSPQTTSVQSDQTQENTLNELKAREARAQSRISAFMAQQSEQSKVTKSFMDDLKNRDIQSARQYLSILAGENQYLRVIADCLEAADEIKCSNPTIIKKDQIALVTAYIMTINKEIRPCFVTTSGKVFDLNLEKVNGSKEYDFLSNTLMAKSSEDWGYPYFKKDFINKSYQLGDSCGFYGPKCYFKGQKKLLFVLTDDRKLLSYNGSVSRIKFEKAFGLHRGDKFRFEDRELTAIHNKCVNCRLTKTSSGWKITGFDIFPLEYKEREILDTIR